MLNDAFFYHWLVAEAITNSAMLQVVIVTVLVYCTIYLSIIFFSFLGLLFFDSVDFAIHFFLTRSSKSNIMLIKKFSKDQISLISDRIVIDGIEKRSIESPIDNSHEKALIRNLNQVMLDFNSKAWFPKIRMGIQIGSVVYNYYFDKYLTKE
jgi:hypothetical protein